MSKLYNITRKSTVIIQFNSAEFNVYLLMCIFNSKSANYKARTGTQVQHKNQYKYMKTEHQANKQTNKQNNNNNNI